MAEQNKEEQASTSEEAKASPEEVQASPEEVQYVVKKLPEEIEKKWYILRVQSGKEDRVKANLEKRITTLNMEDEIPQVVVPSELVSEIKKGSKRVIERKLYPGYVMVEMAFTVETQFLVKNTPGVGDFVGTPEKPIPMSDEEVERMLHHCAKPSDKPKPKVSFRKGQNIKIKEGPFENFDGIVDEVNEQKGIVKVIVGIFGRYTQVELEYWQVESL